MLNGGYKIINLRGFALGTEATVIDGIYEAIEGNYGKAIMLSGLTIGGVEKPDAFVTANVDSGNFVIEVYGQKITITDEDEVILSDIDKAYIVKFSNWDTTTQTYDIDKTFDDIVNHLPNVSAYIEGDDLFIKLDNFNYVVDEDVITFTDFSVSSESVRAYYYAIMKEYPKKGIFTTNNL